MREITSDFILGRRVRIDQPRKGFRVAVDTVLLAAAIPATSGDAVFDLGCGVGGVLLAVACRVPGLKEIVGIDIQENLIVLAQRNACHNRAFINSANFTVSDATSLPQDMQRRFEHVAINPPWHSVEHHPSSPDNIKRIANTEAANAPLTRWLANAASAVAENGTITIIHRADREQEIVAKLADYFAEINIRSVVTMLNKPASRTIIQARRKFAGDKISSRKKAAVAIAPLPPLVLMTEAGIYTEEAYGILWQAKSMRIIDE